MTVEFAEPISSIPSVLETDEKRMFSQVRSLKELKIEHEFKDKISSGCSFFEKFSIKDTSLERAFKTTLIPPSYGSMS